MHFSGSLCQLWPKCIAPGRETQRFYVSLLMCLLLQQLQQQNASALGPIVFGPRAQTSVWKHFAAEAAEVAKT